MIQMADDNLITVKDEDVKSKETVKAHGKKEDSLTFDTGFLKRPLFWQFISFILFVAFIVALFSSFNDGVTGAVISDVDARQTVQDYVDAVIAGRAEAVVGEVTKERGLYLIPVDIAGQRIQSYLTLDGKIFFPNAVDLEQLDDILNAPPVTGGVVEDEFIEDEEDTDSVEVNES